MHERTIIQITAEGGIILKVLTEVSTQNSVTFKNTLQQFRKN